MRGLDKYLPMFSRETAQLPNGLNERLNTFVGNLSGGQRQTLSFLMATIQRPKLLLLDEHTAALDPNTSRELLELTNKVVQQQKLTYVSGEKRQKLTEDDILQYFTD